ncbi:MAG: hypothetical protein ACI8UO_003094 [Verrucomicrobiales bacterium]|jgi:hypothetical protein
MKMNFESGAQSRAFNFSVGVLAHLTGMGVAYGAILYMNHLVSSRPIPPAFGLEYLPCLIPLGLSLISLPFVVIAILRGFYHFRDFPTNLMTGTVLVLLSNIVYFIFMFIGVWFSILVRKILAES